MNKIEEITNVKLNFDIKDKYVVAYQSNSEDVEYFSLFDRRDEPLLIESKQVIAPRPDCHGSNRIKNIYHRGANVFWLQDGKLFLPVRAKSKDLYPNMGDVSISEHLLIDEGYITGAIRGIKEEIGLKIGKKDLKFLFKSIVEDSNNQEWSSYYLLETKDKKAIISDETKNYKWIDIKKIDVKKLNFRPDHLFALEKFIKQL